MTLLGDLHPEIDVRLKDLQSARGPLDALVIRTDNLHVAYDFDSIALQETVRGAFVKRVRTAGLAPETERKVLVTGLRALDGRSDLEVD